MKIKYSYQDYLFLSSRIRAMENALLSRNDLKEMADARSYSELCGMLEKRGITAETDVYGEKSFERSLSTLLDTAYLDILGSVPSPELFSFFTYQYDCINLKTAIKCSEKGITVNEKLLPYGTVSVENVKEAVLKRSFDAFSSNMALAAVKAISGFAKNGDPQEIDLLLDRALYLDIKSSVDKNPIELFHTLLEVKADTVNIITALRIKNLGGGISLFERAFVSGGTLALAALSEVFTVGIGALSGLLKNGRYERITYALSDRDGNITEAEKIAAVIYFDLIRSTRASEGGAEVVIGFIASLMAEVRNIRTLLAVKKRMTDPWGLLERIRKGYV